MSIERLIQKYPGLEPCAPDIQRAFETLRAVYRRGGKLLVCGNGGSAADSEHIVGELMKGFLLKRLLPEPERQELLRCFPVEGAYLADHLQGALPAICLSSQVSLLTAFSNDVAADMAFAQQVWGYGKPGDALLGISTSGSSPNVVHALQVARVRQMHTIGLTGEDGGKLKALCEVTVCAPSNRTPEIQEQHVAIYHTLCLMLEEEFFSANVTNETKSTNM
jgi:D-sedoheptulose 7-phosphate isomerase